MKTHARASGGAFPAVRDVGLVGVVGVAQQRAGGGRAAAPGGAGFTQLDSTFLLCVVLCCGGLTPLGMSHAWGGVLANCRHIYINLIKMTLIISILWYFLGRKVI